jgi:hypothetical protein
MARTELQNITQGDHGAVAKATGSSSIEQRRIGGAASEKIMLSTRGKYLPISAV